MDSVERLSEEGTQRAKECLSLLKFSEGLVRRDIDLARIQLELRLKKLETRLLAELRDLVENETFKVEETVANVNEIVKCARANGPDKSTADRLRNQVNSLQKTRLKFEGNSTIQDVFDKFDTFGTITCVEIVGGTITHNVNQDKDSSGGEGENISNGIREHGRLEPEGSNTVAVRDLCRNTGETDDKARSDEADIKALNVLENVQGYYMNSNKTFNAKVNDIKMASRVPTHQSSGSENKVKQTSEEDTYPKSDINGLNNENKQQDILETLKDLQERGRKLTISRIPVSRTKSPNFREDKEYVKKEQLDSDNERIALANTMWFGNRDGRSNDRVKGRREMNMKLNVADEMSKVRRRMRARSESPRSYQRNTGQAKIDATNVYVARQIKSEQHNEEKPKNLKSVAISSYRNGKPDATTRDERTSRDVRNDKATPKSKDSERETKVNGKSNACKMNGTNGVSERAAGVTKPSARDKRRRNRTIHGDISAMIADARTFSDDGKSSDNFKRDTKAKLNNADDMDTDSDCSFYSNDGISKQSKDVLRSAKSAHKSRIPSCNEMLYDR
ncbi:uncharacterized protein LOC128221487 [Mya arenaria]|uniref:uncharacterized protein LOC128221487 n=1 Tax=Mya arenaria TaxID=6604 RepID=UPI0022DEFCD3|nr:uncharacterized protein LOC128221487 [Mya arenaria]